MSKLLLVLLTATAAAALSGRPSRQAGGDAPCGSDFKGRKSSIAVPAYAIIEDKQTSGSLNLTKSCTSNVVGAYVLSCDYDQAPVVTIQASLAQADIFRQGNSAGDATVNATVYCDDRVLYRAWIQREQGLQAEGPDPGTDEASRSVYIPLMPPPSERGEGPDPGSAEEARAAERMGEM